MNIYKIFSEMLIALVLGKKKLANIKSNISAYGHLGASFWW